MIELSNTVAQRLTPGQSMVFNDVILHTGCSECHRENTGSIKMRANGIYEVSFGANISCVENRTDVELSIQIGGTTLPETRMISAPGAAGFNSVYRTTLVKNCCGDYDRITVTNTGTVDVIIDAHPVLIVKRVA